MLVVGRNEAGNLPTLFTQVEKEIEQLNCFIFVDDHSEDGSLEIAEKFASRHPGRVLVLKAEGRENFSPKKSGILTGLRSSKSEWVWLIDADVRLRQGSIHHKRLLLTEVASDVVAGPVIEIEAGNNLWSCLSSVEQAMMNTLYRGSINLGRPLLCSGANLAFRRRWFEDRAPFDLNGHLYSGDDLAILEASGNSIIFDDHRLSMVETIGPRDLRAFYRQRIRRAGKLRHTGSTGTKVFGLFSLAAGLICLIYFPVRLLGGDLTEKIIVGTSLVSYLGVMTAACIKGYHGEPRDFFGVLKTLLAGYFYPIFTGIIPLLIFTNRVSWKGRAIG